MKALTWHGKGDSHCDSVPDPRIEDSRDAIDLPSGQTFNCSGFAGRSLGSTIASTRAARGNSSALLIAGTTSSGRSHR